MQTDDDKLKPWKTLSQDIAYENKWFRIRHRHMLTSTGKEADYYIHEANESVLCVCVNGEGKVLVERQYRPPIEGVSVDYPAGRVEQDDANTRKAIIRELREETGLSATSVKKLSVVDVNPGFSAARCHIFLVQGLTDGQDDPDDNESIVRAFVTPAEILGMIQTGEISCPFCISATFLAFQELGWLTATTSTL